MRTNPDRDARQDPSEDGDLTDMLGEMRVLLPTAQLLSAFLTTVPFTSGFRAIDNSEKHVFLATFILAVSSLALLSAPAVQHRLLRPLTDRVRFKRLASRQIVLGAACLSLSLVLVTQFVLSEVLGRATGNGAAVLITTLLLALWWVFPKIWRNRGHL